MVLKTKKKLIGEGQTNLPDDLGISQSKNQSSLKKKEDGTKTVDSNSIDSTTTTSTVISNKKNVSRSTENTIVEKHMLQKKIAINLILTIKRSKI